MGIYIPDMEIPKEPDEMIEIAIFGDGQVVQTGESWRCIENGKCYYTITNPEKFFNAVSVPPHGRLIDADAVKADWEHGFYKKIVDALMDDAPTVIEAEPCNDLAKPNNDAEDGE